MGTLHVVSTPIGNQEDITLRALRVLGEAELLFAEDTRRTRILLDHHGINAKPVSLHAHNEAGRCGQALKVLGGGADVAIVSDAGTPLLSDPGERLVAAAIEAGHRVEAVPGASALLAALTVSGLAPLPFAFFGFPARKAGERRRHFASLAERAETLIFYESPRRVARTLLELAEALGEERRACLARELTKLHEEVARGSLAELASQFAEGARGEVVLLVEGQEEAGASTASPEEVDAQVGQLLDEGLSTREVAEQLAAELRLPKRQVYARALALRRRSQGRRGRRKLMNLPRLLRTLRHLRPEQAVAQLRHALRPGVHIHSAGDPSEPADWAIGTLAAPLPPPPRHIAWRASGQLRMVGLEALAAPAAEGVDWQADAGSPLYAYHLHFFEWARSPLASSEQRRGVGGGLGRQEPGVAWRQRLGPAPACAADPELGEASLFVTRGGRHAARGRGRRLDASFPRRPG